MNNLGEEAVTSYVEAEKRPSINFTVFTENEKMADTLQVPGQSRGMCKNKREKLMKIYHCDSCCI